ncbi:MAG: cell division protein FtsH [Anaerolineaceae bacterium 4572_32.1]|nr:MAG: cell division protein FtsH [Anaerolineaceae bacterium 4572_32.1]
MVDSGRFRNGLVYFIILVAAVGLLYSFTSQAKPLEVTISTVAQQIRENKISRLTSTSDEQSLEIEYKAGTTVFIDHQQITVGNKDGDHLPVVAYKERGTSVVETLTGLGVTDKQIQAITLRAEPPSDLGNWLAILGSILPMLFFGGVIYFMLRQAQGSNNQAISFGKSRARMFTGDKPTITFDDVAGVEEAKEELYEVVEFLKEPEKFIALGARIPKGVLLVGAPGTGKTLMAKAVSGEAGVPFFSISGSEFVEMFVGVGASRVRDLFDQAKRHSPCIVFVDEIDAVGRHRGAGLGGSHDEREQTLNQILVEMDGFDTDTNVIIVAATNRPDILDPALMRPGRFDRRVVLDRPDMRGREAILQVHVRGKPLAADVDLSTIAKQTPGFVGADLENLINEGAILAARANKKAIGTDEFQEAIERVIAGPERRSRLISDEEKEVIAYHESGHTLVQWNLDGCDPVHKVTIVSRGMAMGYTMALPEEDHYLRQKSRFKDQLAGMLGGRAAEELIFNDITTGASNDLERATQLARKMVTRYGMSDTLGPMTFGKKDELVFLGREISEQRDYSEQTAQQIDSEVKKIINEAYKRAKNVLTEHHDKLVAIANKLIEVETLDSADLEAMLA